VSEIVEHNGDGQSRVIRPQVGLMLSIGEAPTSGRNYPKKLDYFRPKLGALGQYAEAAEKFREAFGDQPRSVEILLVSNEMADVFDVRFKVWGQSGLKAVGKTNLATLSPEAFGDRLYAYEDELTTFPDKEPEPGTYQLTGPDDPAISKLGGKVYGTFRFAIPAVTSLTTLAEISTTSKRSIQNIHSGLRLAQKITEGQLVGIPFLLRVRPARARFWDEKKKKRSTTEFYELIVEPRHSLLELYAAVEERRRALASGAPRLELPPVRHDDAERDRELAEALWTPEGERQVEDVAGGLELPADEDAEVVDEDGNTDADTLFAGQDK
jgi:hypothetical protein